MEQKSLYRDLSRNPRSSENSRIVISSWGTPVDGYVSESPAYSDEKTCAVSNYYALSAERMLYRKKVLSLSIDETFASNEALQRAHPFGQDGPDFASLYVPSVSIAMAFIPLMPEGGSGKPVLARLYCIKGLASSSPPPFADGADFSALAGYSWFVAGLPDKLASEPIIGKSWLLAAHLLMNVVGENGTASTKKNLATRFIVTGDVANGDIGPVEMGRKPELATIKEYRSLKWIIPVKNSNDMTNIPSRFAEKPATLEEAYELIESMQSRATKSFFRFLKIPDLDGMKEQFEIGADIFDDDPKTHKGALQLAAEAQAKAKEEKDDVQELNRMKNRSGTDVKVINAVMKAYSGQYIRQWLDRQGFVIANPQAIVFMAKSGMDEALKQVIERFPINTRDEEGLTAVDYALFDRDWTLAQRLHSLGGCCDYDGTVFAWEDVLRVVFDTYVTPTSDDMRLDARTMLMNALQVGLDPDARNMFSRAIQFGDVTLAEACIKAGRNPNKELAQLGFGESRIPILAVAENKSGALDEKQRDAFIAMLFMNGVEKTPELEHKIELAKGRSCVHNARRCVQNGDVEGIVRALDDGHLSFDDVFPIDAVYDEIIGDEKNIDGSLFALALDRGWVSVVAKCLEKGASPINDFSTTCIDYAGARPSRFVCEQGAPIDFVNRVKRSLSPEKKKEIVALLQSYIAKKAGKKPEELDQD